MLIDLYPFQDPRCQRAGHRQLCGGGGESFIWRSYPAPCLFSPFASRALLFARVRVSLSLLSLDLNRYQAYPEEPREHEDLMNSTGLMDPAGEPRKHISSNFLVVVIQAERRASCLPLLTSRLPLSLPGPCKFYSDPYAYYEGTAPPKDRSPQPHTQMSPDIYPGPSPGGNRTQPVKVGHSPGSMHSFCEKRFPLLHPFSPFSPSPLHHVQAPPKLRSASFYLWHDVPESKRGPAWAPPSLPPSPTPVSSFCFPCRTPRIGFVSGTFLTCSSAPSRPFCAERLNRCPVCLPDQERGGVQARAGLARGPRRPPL